MKSSIAGLIGIIALALLVAGHYLGLGYTVGVSIALSAVFGFGWPHYLAIPAKKTLGAVIALTGAASAVTVGLTRSHEYLVWTPIYLAVGFGAVMVVQLIRGTGQKHRLESTLGAGAGVLISGFSCGWVASLRHLEDPGMTLIVATSAAVALAAGMLPWPDRVVAPLAIALAALAGPLVALAFSDVRIVPAMVLGVVVGSVIAAFRRLRTLTVMTVMTVMTATGGTPAEPEEQVGPAAPGEQSAPQQSGAQQKTPRQSSPQKRGAGRAFGAIAASVAPVLALGSLVYFVEKLLLR